MPFCIDPRTLREQAPTSGPNPLEFSLIRGFKNAPPDQVPISLEELEREYCRLTGQKYPIVEQVFVRSWMLFRVSQSATSCL